MRDEYETVVNNPETYSFIAKALLKDGNILIPWTDGEGSQLDILLNLLFTPAIGPIQGGIESDYLFVSIMRVGAFAFRIGNNETTGDYYSEKLGLTSGATADKLAVFLNGVRKELNEKHS